MNSSINRDSSRIHGPQIIAVKYWTTALANYSRNTVHSSNRLQHQTTALDWEDFPLPKEIKIPRDSPPKIGKV